MKLTTKTDCSGECRRRNGPTFRKACRLRFASHTPATQLHAKIPRTCFEGPFAEVLRTTGPMAVTNPFRFSSKYQDSETDLLYYGYRYYNASTGRWLSRDPIGENGGHNTYCFVRNTSPGSIDALGMVRFGDENWPCPVCRCGDVDLTFDPGGENFQLGYYEGGLYWRFGNDIKVKWNVFGNRGACRYYQDENGSDLTVRIIAPFVSAPEQKKGVSKQVPQSYTDHLGWNLEPGFKYAVSGIIKITFRCVGSAPESQTKERTITTVVPMTVVSTDEIDPL